jgi:hypothetical protein
MSTTTRAMLMRSCVALHEKLSGVKRIALVLALVLLAAFAAEVWHRFVWFGARAKGAEARRNLTLLCQKQRELKVPVAHFRELGVELERGNRYAYFLAPGRSLEERGSVNTDATGLQVDVEKFGPSSIEYRLSERSLPTSVRVGDGVFIAAGNIDADPEFDVWSVSTRSDPPCAPVHEVDDIPPGPVSRLFQ